MRYRMAMDEGKYDTALIFLNKILEVEPLNLEAKIGLGEIFHLHLHDYTRAVEQYNKVIKLTARNPENELHARARASMTEILELLS
jgi:tetratricopeptide (TPR) repeat protein